MSIVSHAFGRVELTGADAVKFKNQATFGRPRPAARRSVEEGLRLSQSLGEHGSIVLQLLKPA